MNAHLLALVWLASCAAASHVRIEPAALPAHATYPHTVGVDIFAPWQQQGHWTLRAPETLGSDHGLLFIDHERPDMLPVAWPVHPLSWRRLDDGALFLACELDNRCLLVVKAIPCPNGVSIVCRFTNAGAHALSNLGTQFCLVQTHVSEFRDPRGKRTFIYSQGRWIRLCDTKPGLPKGERPFFIITNTYDLAPWSDVTIPRSWGAEEQADVPLIATVSKDGRRLIGLAFDNSYKIMSNCEIPCIHADPKFADCPPGETVEIRGRVYLLEGSLNDLLACFQRDFPQWPQRSLDDQ